ncbi:MAG: nucleoside hydrolase [Erysipelotrichia bacterium]|nr:nucleoside hydrolase [Erysipelotrichia bacterium]
MKKKLIIDTDCGSDDAVALIMALREPRVEVKAITVTSGNCPMQQAAKNVLQSIYYAQTYQPPVYKGTSLPLWCDYEDASQVHGIDGMGDCPWLKRPEDKFEAEHAVDALIHYVKQEKGDLEILAIGPLTNIAAAILQDPQTMRSISKLTVMGGAHPYNNPHTVSAEFNIMCDPEAAKIVFDSRIPITMCTLESCWGTMRFEEEDIQYFKELNELGSFCMDINRVMINAAKKNRGVGSMDLPDAGAFASITCPELIENCFDAFVRIETSGTYTRGATIFETKEHHYRNDFIPNCQVVTKIDGVNFKKYLANLIK